MLESLAFNAASSSDGGVIRIPPLPDHFLVLRSNEFIQKRNDTLGDRRRVIANDFLQIRWKRFDPFFVHDNNGGYVRLIDLGNIFSCVVIVERCEYSDVAQ